MSKKIIFTDRSNELLKQYFKDISKYKIYPPEEFNNLIIKAHSGNIVARDKAITSNLKFVITIAKQFQNKGVPLMDLISAGNIGLQLAVDKFDPEKGVPFLSYAVWWIKREIHSAIYWHGKSIRLPVSQQLIVIKIIDATTKLTKELNRHPTSDEISKYTGIPIKQIDYLSQFSNNLVSVDDFVHGDEDNSQVCDIIADTNTELPDDLTNEMYVRNEIERILPKLTIREHDVIVMEFGIGMPKVDRKTICTMFNVTYERIRQIKESALRKLRTVHKNSLKKLL